jgi:hypothetical protein
MEAPMVDWPYGTLEEPWLEMRSYLGSQSVIRDWRE